MNDDRPVVGKTDSMDSVWRHIGAPLELAMFQRELWLQNQWKLAQLGLRFDLTGATRVELARPEITSLSTLFKLHAICTMGDVYILCCDCKEAEQKLWERRGTW